MKSFLVTLPLVLMLFPAMASAESDPQKPAEKPSSPGNPYITFTKETYEGIQGILLRSAEKVPEEYYSFKPTDAVRSYGQILGHVADAQYYFCSKVLGEKNPAPKIEQTKTSKADLIAALKDAFAYCGKAYDGMTDASGAQLIPMFREDNDTPKLSVLTVNNLHSVEHYGNLVTYMRLKNIVPPTSEPGFSPSNPPPPKK